MSSVWMHILSPAAQNKLQQEGLTNREVFKCIADSEEEFRTDFLHWFPPGDHETLCAIFSGKQTSNQTRVNAQLIQAALDKPIHIQAPDPKQYRKRAFQPVIPRSTAKRAKGTRPPSNRLSETSYKNHQSEDLTKWLKEAGSKSSISNLDTKAINFILNSGASTTRDNYISSFKKYISWCKAENVEWMSPSPSDISTYVIDAFETAQNKGHSGQSVPRSVTKAIHWIVRLLFCKNFISFRTRISIAFCHNFDLLRNTTGDNSRHQLPSENSC